MRHIFLLFLTVLITYSCADDDTESIEQEQSQNENVINGGTIASFQLVNQQVENLVQESYQGVVNGATISLVRSDTNTLTFLVNDNFTIGENTVVIEELNTFINYTVNETILQNTVDENIQELSNIYANRIAEFPNTNNTPQELFVINTVANFNNALEQFSPEERETIALVFEVNANFFNTLFDIDFTIPQSKAASDFSNLSFGELAGNWALATIGAGSATFLAVASASNLPVALLLGTTAITLWQISFDLWSEGIGRDNILYDQFSWDEFNIDLFERGAEETIEFTSGVAQSFDFDFTSRGVDSTDSGSENTVISSFFNTVVDFNDVVENLNGIITLVNDIPFVDIELIDVIVVGNSEEQLDNITDELFDNISLIVSDNNLTIDNVSFENGQLTIAISIVDPSQVNNSIDSFLNIIYEDETNNVEGSFPISVLNEPGNGNPTNFVFLQDLNQMLDFNIVDNIVLQSTFECENEGGNNDGVTIGVTDFFLSSENITLDGGDISDESFEADQIVFALFENAGFINGVPDGTYVIAATEQNEMDCERIFVDFYHPGIDTTDSNGRNAVVFTNGTITVSENGTRIEMQGNVAIDFESGEQSLGSANGVFVFE